MHHYKAFAIYHCQCFNHVFEISIMELPWAEKHWDELMISVTLRTLIAVFWVLMKTNKKCSLVLERIWILQDVQWKSGCDVPPHFLFSVTANHTQVPLLKKKMCYFKESERFYFITILMTLYCFLKFVHAYQADRLVLSWNNTSLAKICNFEVNWRHFKLHMQTRQLLCQIWRKMFWKFWSYIWLFCAFIR